MLSTTLHTTADYRLQLELALAERFAAVEHGLASNGTYMSELDDEIAAVTAAYVGSAVTEIATLRGELSGRPQG
jgi:hypothetical protein